MVGYLLLILGFFVLYWIGRAVIRYIDNCGKMTWYWKIVQKFKSLQVSGNRKMLQQIHQRLNTQEKPGFLKSTQSR